MRKKRKTLLGITALAFTLCLSMPVMSGTTFAEKCENNGDGTVTDNTQARRM